MRTGHPAGIELSSLRQVNNWGTVEWDYKNYKIVYNFSDSLIQMGDGFVIGYSLWCANDVALTPVPEPGLLILLGIGLSAVGLASRRFRNKMNK